MFKELGPKFEEKLLSVATCFAETEIQSEGDDASTRISLSLENGEEVEMEYSTSCSYSITVQISKQELQKWKDAYTRDPHFNLVVGIKENEQEVKLTFPQYHRSEEGLVYFEDLLGNT